MDENKIKKEARILSCQVIVKKELQAKGLQEENDIKIILKCIREILSNDKDRIFDQYSDQEFAELIIEEFYNDQEEEEETVCLS